MSGDGFIEYLSGQLAEPVDDKDKTNLWAAFGMGVIAGVVFVLVAAMLIADSIRGQRNGFDDWN